MALTAEEEAHMAQATLPPWIQALQQRDPQFAESYLAQRERIYEGLSLAGVPEGK